MKSRLTVFVTGVVGSFLIVYGSIVQSSVGLVGLFLTVVAIIAAGLFRRISSLKRDERGADAAVLTSLLGH